MTWEAWLISLCINITILTFVSWLFSLRRKRPIIYVLKPDLGQWLDINNNPVPETEAFEYFIATDGERVDSMYFKNYDSQGKLVMSRYGPVRYVKYWRPLPLPPDY